MVRFTAGEATWLAPVEHVVAVRVIADVRPLPAPSPGVAGVIERDGRTWPVVDALEATPGRHVLVVEAAGQLIGVITDEVSGVADLPAEQFRPGPAGQHRRYVEATCELEGDLAYVLDPTWLVDDVIASEEVQHA